MVILILNICCVFDGVSTFAEAIYQRKLYINPGAQPRIRNRAVG
jgi:hypothetical protein